MIEMGKDEIKTEFLEEANVMFIEEKKHRQDGSAEDSSLSALKFSTSLLIRVRLSALASF